MRRYSGPTSARSWTRATTAVLVHVVPGLRLRIGTLVRIRKQVRKESRPWALAFTRSTTRLSWRLFKPATERNKCADEQRHCFLSLPYYTCVRHAAIAAALSTRHITRRERTYNTVHVWRIIPHVRGVDYREPDVSLRDS